MNATSTAALVPALAPLDELVRAALSDHGQRADAIGHAVQGLPYWRCTACAREVPASERTRRAWKNGEATQCLGCLERSDWDSAAAGQTLQPVRVATPEQVREVREILRGLERVGHAWQRGGWWSR